MESSNFKEGTLSVAGSFAAPVFRLTQDSHDLQAELYSRLKPYGLVLDQIEENGAYSGPAGWSLVMRFLGFQAQLWIKVGGYELTLSSITLESVDEGLPAILDAIEGAIRSSIENESIEHRAFRFYGHFSLDGGYEAFIERLKFTPPKELESLKLSGASFVLTDPSTGVVNTTVILEKSIRVPEGLFLNAGCLVDSHEDDLPSISERFRSYLVDVLCAFGLAAKQE